MKYFKNILMPIVRAEPCMLPVESIKAVDQAIRIAKNSNAKLTFIAFENISPTIINYWSIEKNILVESIEDFCQELLSSYVHHANSNGIEAASSIIWGHPIKKILQTIKDNDFDLIIKEASYIDIFNIHRLSGDDLNILRQASIPVLLISQNHKYARTARKILVALDIHAKDQALNDRLLTIAQSFVEQGNNDELHIIHTWILPNEDYMSKIGGRHVPPRSLLLNGKKKAAEDHHRLLKNFIEKNSPDTASNIKKHLIRGRASLEICKLSKELPADLLIMGTHARSGLERFMIGNTAENIASSVDCSLLVVS